MELGRGDNEMQVPTASGRVADVGWPCEHRDYTELEHHSEGIIGALIAVSAWGIGTVITKHIDMGALAVGTYRFTLYGASAIIS